MKTMEEMETSAQKHKIQDELEMLERAAKGLTRAFQFSSSGQIRSYDLLKARLSTVAYRARTAEKLIEAWEHKEQQ